MSDNKNNIFANPVAISAGISLVLSSVLKNQHIAQRLQDYQEIIEGLLAPLSILLSYGIVWLFAKFYVLSIPERKALSILESKEKRIKKQLKKNSTYLNEKTKNELQEELNRIAIEKAKIGSQDTKLF